MANFRAASHFLFDFARRKWQLPLYKRATWALLWAHLALQLLIWLPLHWGNLAENADWRSYYHAAQRVNNGQSAYEPRPEWGPDSTPNMYLYPPTFAATMAPLGRLQPQQFTVLWYSLLLLSHWLFAWSLAALQFNSLKPTLLAVLVWGLVLQCFPGHRATMSFGNLQPIINALWGMSLLGALGGAWRGTMISVATWWKLQPMWALILLMRHEPKTRISALVTIGLYGLLGAWVCGIGSYADWWRNASSIVNQGTFNADNYSASFAFLRLAHWSGLWHYDGGPLPNGPRLLMSALAVLAPLCAMWATRHFSLNLRCAIVVSVAVWWSPLCWSTYFPLFLPALILWWRQRNTAEVSI